DGHARADRLGVARRHRDRLAGPDGDRLVGADRLRAIGPDRDVLVAADFFRPVGSDRRGLVAADRDRLVDRDIPAAVVAYVLAEVVIDRGVLVVLAVDPDHLVVAAPLVRLRLGAADDFLVRQAVGGHLLGIVDAARDQGAVGISFEEIDDDLLAHPGYDHSAEPLASHLLGDPDPAGALVVLLALAIPEELNLDPAILVDVDLLTRRAGHDGGLNALDHRLGCGPGGAVDDRGRDAGEEVVIGGAVRGRSVTGLGGRMADRGDHVIAVLGGDVMPLESELAAGGKGGALAGAVRCAVTRLLFFHPDLRHRLAVALDDVLAGIVEDLELGSVRQIDHCAGCCQQVGAGGLEVVVGPGPLAGAKLVLVLPALDVVGRERTR